MTTNDIGAAAFNFAGAFCVAGCTGLRRSAMLAASGDLNGFEKQFQCVECTFDIPLFERILMGMPVSNFPQLVKEVTLSGRECIVKNLMLLVGRDSDQRLHIQVHAADVGRRNLGKAEASFLKPAVFVLTPHSFFDKYPKTLL